MTLDELVATRVRVMYREEDLNCAHVTLGILSEALDTEVTRQVFDSASGMPGGAGFYGAQCGLIQGAIMFIGILGRRRECSEEAIAQTCHDCVAEFEKKLGSLICREIRPEGFAEDNPPHLCEPRTIESIAWAARFISTSFGLPLPLPDRE